MAILHSERRIRAAYLSVCSKYMRPISIGEMVYAAYDGSIAYSFPLRMALDVPPRLAKGRHREAGAQTTRV